MDTTATPTPAVGDRATLTHEGEDYEVQVVRVGPSLLTGKPVAVLCRLDMLAERPDHKTGLAVAFDDPSVVWHAR